MHIPSLISNSLTLLLLTTLSLPPSTLADQPAAWDAKGSGLCHDHKKASSILSAYKDSITASGPFHYTGSYKIGCWAFNGGIRACAFTKCSTSVQSICLVTRDMKPDFKYDSGLVAAYAEELVVGHGIEACGSIAVENNATIGGGEGNGYLSFRYTEETKCLTNDHLWDHYTECGFNQQG